jgi:hypothetical protein
MAPHIILLDRDTRPELYPLMTLHDLIVIIAALLNLTVFGGCAYWVVRWLRSLKGTVDAQAETISTLRTVIDAMDLPKMLERFKAYKKITDRQKEAEVQEIERKFSEQQAALVQSGEESKKGYEQDRIDFIDLILDLMPYVRKEIRYKVIASSNFSDELKHTLQDTARKLPICPGLCLRCWKCLTLIILSIQISQLANFAVLSQSIQMRNLLMFLLRSLRVPLLLLIVERRRNKSKVWG